MKPYILVLVLIVALVGGTYVFSRRSAQTTVAPNSAGNQEAANPESDSRYIPYSKEAFDRASGKKRILFFHAPWCPTCRPADAEFEAKKDSIPMGAVLFKTDYDSSTELKKKYNVTYQHTFVQVDGTGYPLATWNGGGMDDLLSNIK